MPNNLPTYEQVRNDLNNAVTSNEPAAFGKALVDKFKKDPWEKDNAAADNNISLASTYIRRLVSTNENDTIESNSGAQGGELYQSLVSYGTELEMRAFEHRSEIRRRLLNNEIAGVRYLYDDLDKELLDKLVNNLYVTIYREQALELDAYYKAKKAFRDNTPNNRYSYRSSDNDSVTLRNQYHIYLDDVEKHTVDALYSGMNNVHLNPIKELISGNRRPALDLNAPDTMGFKINRDPDVPVYFSAVPDSMTYLSVDVTTPRLNTHKNNLIKTLAKLEYYKKNISRIAEQAGEMLTELEGYVKTDGSPNNPTYDSLHTALQELSESANNDINPSEVLNKLRAVQLAGQNYESHHGIFSAYNDYGKGRLDIARRAQTFAIVNAGKAAPANYNIYNSPISEQIRVYQTGIKRADKIAEQLGLAINDEYNYRSFDSSQLANLTAALGNAEHGVWGGSGQYTSAKRSFTELGNTFAEQVRVLNDPDTDEAQKSTAIQIIKNAVNIAKGDLNAYIDRKRDQGNLKAGSLIDVKTQKRITAVQDCLAFCDILTTHMDNEAQYLGDDEGLKSTFQNAVEAPVPQMFQPILAEAERASDPGLGEIVKENIENVNRRNVPEAPAENARVSIEIADEPAVIKIDEIIEPKSYIGKLDQQINSPESYERIAAAAAKQAYIDLKAAADMNQLPEKQVTARKIAAIIHNEQIYKGPDGYVKTADAQSAQNEYDKAVNALAESEALTAAAGDLGLKRVREILTNPAAAYSEYHKQMYADVPEKEYIPAVPAAVMSPITAYRKMLTDTINDKNGTMLEYAARKALSTQKQLDNMARRGAELDKIGDCILGFVFFGKMSEMKELPQVTGEFYKDNDIAIAEQEKIRDDPEFEEFVKNITDDKIVEFAKDPSKVYTEYKSFTAELERKAEAEKAKEEIKPDVPGENANEAGEGEIDPAEAVLAKKAYVRKIIKTEKEQPDTFYELAANSAMKALQRLETIALGKSKSKNIDNSIATIIYNDRVPNLKDLPKYTGDPYTDSELVPNERNKIKEEPAFKEFMKGVTPEKLIEFVNDPTQISKQYESFAVRFGKEAGAEIIADQPGVKKHLSAKAKITRETYRRDLMQIDKDRPDTVYHSAARYAISGLETLVKLDSGYTQNTPDKLLNAVSGIIYYEHLSKQSDIPKMNSLEESEKFVRTGTNDLKNIPAFKEFVGRIDADKLALYSEFPCRAAEDYDTFAANYEKEAAKAKEEEEFEDIFGWGEEEKPETDRSRYFAKIDNNIREDKGKIYYYTALNAKTAINTLDGMADGEIDSKKLTDSLAGLIYREKIEKSINVPQCSGDFQHDVELIRPEVDAIRDDPVFKQFVGGITKEKIAEYTASPSIVAIEYEEFAKNPERYAKAGKDWEKEWEKEMARNDPKKRINEPASLPVYLHIAKSQFITDEEAPGARSLPVKRIQFKINTDETVTIPLFGGIHDILLIRGHDMTNTMGTAASDAAKNACVELSELTNQIDGEMTPQQKEQVTTLTARIFTDIDVHQENALRDKHDPDMTAFSEEVVKLKNTQAFIETVDNIKTKEDIYSFLNNPHYYRKQYLQRAGLVRQDDPLIKAAYSYSDLTTEKKEQLLGAEKKQQAPKKPVSSYKLNAEGLVSMGKAKDKKGTYGAAMTSFTQRTVTDLKGLWEKLKNNPEAPLSEKDVKYFNMVKAGVIRNADIHKPINSGKAEKTVSKSIDKTIAGDNAALVKKCKIKGIFKKAYKAQDIKDFIDDPMPDVDAYLRPKPVENKKTKGMKK